MSLTRAAIEAEIIDRIGPRMSYVGMPVVQDGTNTSLNGPIRRALAEMGCATATPLVVTDSDLAGFIPAGSLVPAANAWRIEQLCDRATLQALKSVLLKTTDVDWMAGQDQVRASQFMAAVRADIDDLEAKIMQPYGPNIPPAVVGGMNPAMMPNDVFQPCDSRSAPHAWPYPYKQYP